MSENLGEIVGKMLSIEDISPEVQEQLLEVKKGIAKEYVIKMVKDKPSLIIMKDQLESFLVNDGGVKDFFLDIFREHAIGILAPEQVEKFCYVKEKLSGMKEVPTSEALSALKSDILEAHSLGTDQTSQTNEGEGQSSSQSTSQEEQNPVDSQESTSGSPESTSGSPEESNDNTSDDSNNSQEQQDNQTPSTETGSQTVSEQVDGISEAQGPFIEQVYKAAASQIGVGYKWGGTSPETGFDCSGLWNWAFKQQGIKFKQRLTAESFSFSDVDITKDKVGVGDFMYWDQKAGKKKHSSIYHIEMVISKPYQKNGKMYVRTLGSSTDAKDDCRNYVGKGVRVREREMKDYRHYGRPPYYYQLAEYQRTGNSNNLVATANKPSKEIIDNVA